MIHSLKWEEVLTKKPTKKSRSPAKSEELIEGPDDGLNAIDILLKHFYFTRQICFTAPIVGFDG